MELTMQPENVEATEVAEVAAEVAAEAAQAALSQLRLEPQDTSAAAPRAHDLLGLALDAVRIRPRRYLASVLGLPRTWIPPYRRYSELTVFTPWQLARTLRTLRQMLVPTIPRTPPTGGPPLLHGLFWQPTMIMQQPDHHGSYTSFPDEAWFYLNGILTNDIIARTNAGYLAYLFHRPLTMVQNATNSWLLDFFECVVGKHWHHMTESATKAFPVIYDAIKRRDKQRVVVIAHSQGTIIMSCVLSWLRSITPVPEQRSFSLLGPGHGREPPVVVYPSEEDLDLNDFEPLTLDELAKLEVYCFATCATDMHYAQPPGPGQAPIPWIEHFGNEHDLVARLGMQAPNPERWKVQIDGPRYIRGGAWGHLLVEHYLLDLEARQRQGRKRGARGGPAPFAPASPTASTSTPRLFHYINGGVPPK